jgi:hypothetical protein
LRFERKRTNQGYQYLGIGLLSEENLPNPDADFDEGIAQCSFDDQGYTQAEAAPQAAGEPLRPY